MRRVYLMKSEIHFNTDLERVIGSVVIDSFEQADADGQTHVIPRARGRCDPVGISKAMFIIEDDADPMLVEISK
jgi:hypothetical protein